MPDTRKLEEDIKHDNELNLIAPKPAYRDRTEGRRALFSYCITNRPRATNHARKEVLHKTAEQDHQLTIHQPLLSHISSEKSASKDA